MPQGRHGLVTVIRADGAVDGSLAASLVLDGDGPCNTPDLLWEDVDTLGGDAADAVVQGALLLFVGAQEAVAAGQIVGDQGGGAPVGLGICRTVGCHGCDLVLCQERGLQNPVCGECSTADLGCLHMQCIHFHCRNIIACSSGYPTYMWVTAVICSCTNKG